MSGKNVSLSRHKLVFNREDHSHLLAYRYAVIGCCPQRFYAVRTSPFKANQSVHFLSGLLFHSRQEVRHLVAPRQLFCEKSRGTWRTGDDSRCADKPDKEGVLVGLEGGGRD